MASSNENRQPPCSSDTGAAPKLSEKKARLRRQLLDARARLSSSTRRDEARDVAHHVARFIDAQTGDDAPVCVATYVAVRDELDPTAVIERLRELRGVDRIRAVYPRCEGDALVFCPSDGTWRDSRFNIPEPTTAPVDDAAIDWMLVPVIGIDADGVRLGYGGGFYDRFLSSAAHLQPRTIGLAYREQLVGEPLPCAAHDIPLSYIATADALVRSGAGAGTRSGA